MLSRIQLMGRRLAQLTSPLLALKALTSLPLITALKKRAFSFQNAENKTYTVTDDDAFFVKLSEKLENAVGAHQFNLTALDYDASASSTAYIAVLCKDSPHRGLMNELMLSGQEGTGLTDAGILEFTRYAKDICDHEKALSTLGICVLSAIALTCILMICYCLKLSLPENNGRRAPASREPALPDEGKEHQVEGWPSEFIDVELGLLANPSQVVHQGEPSVSPSNNSPRQGEPSPIPSPPNRHGSPYRPEGTVKPSASGMFASQIAMPISDVVVNEDLSPGQPYYALMD